MRSRLECAEFRSRLDGLTKPGNPMMLGTPISFLVTFFDLSGKPFYGQVDGSQFRIARNSVLFTTPNYMIDGTYRANGKGTEVIYQLKRLFGYYYVRIAPVIMFLIVSVFFSLADPNYPLSILLGANVFIVFIGIAVLLQDKFNKKALERRFIRELEIE